MVYPVNETGAQATIAAVEEWILHIGIPQSIIHDRGTAFSTQNLSTGLRSWELPCNRKQHTHSLQIAK